MDEPLQFGPSGVAVGEYHLPMPNRQAVLEAVGEKLRPESTSAHLVEEVEHAIAEYRAWSRVPNDAYFPQPRETTETKLQAMRDAYDAVVSAAENLSDEERLRLGEQGDHRMLVQALGLRNRCSAALANLREESRRRGPRPQVTTRELADAACRIFKRHVNAKITFKDAFPSSWQQFLAAVFTAAGVSAQPDALARELTDLERKSRKPGGRG